MLVLSIARKVASVRGRFPHMFSVRLVILPLLWSASLLPAADPKTAIVHVLNDQMGAWNRGDVAGFSASYAEHCTLIGKTVTEVTREQVLAHYRERYPTPEAMGHLAFSNLQVRLLDDHFATATGKWQLERTATGGGPVGGVFSLVLEFKDGAWRILLDHTS